MKGTYMHLQEAEHLPQTIGCREPAVATVQAAARAGLAVYLAGEIRVETDMQQQHAVWNFTR